MAAPCPTQPVAVGPPSSMWKRLRSRGSVVSMRTPPPTTVSVGRHSAIAITGTPTGGRSTWVVAARGVIVPGMLAPVGPVGPGGPEGPGSPGGPGVPEIPGAPGDPGRPGGPTSPAEPVAPVAPGGPGGPGGPAGPGGPLAFLTTLRGIWRHSEAPTDAQSREHAAITQTTVVIDRVGARGEDHPVRRERPPEPEGDGEEVALAVVGAEQDERIDGARPGLSEELDGGAELGEQQGREPGAVGDARVVRERKIDIVGDHGVRLHGAEQRGGDNAGREEIGARAEPGGVVAGREGGFERRGQPVGQAVLEPHAEIGGTGEGDVGVPD